MIDNEIKKALDKIEPEIADALKPVFDRPETANPFPFPPRPPVGIVKPQTEDERISDFAPVRTITQFLVDIEKICDRLEIRQGDAEKNIAAILKVIEERLARIENSIGVR